MISFIILFCLIFINGLFVLAEISLVSARKSWLENKASQGDERAKVALHLAENPELFLSTAQVGITLIAILTGFYSGETFSPYIRPYVEKISILTPYAGNISTVLIVIVVTFLSIIFGELLPKRTGLFRAEVFARIVARPMLFLTRAGHPIVWLLN